MSLTYDQLLDLKINLVDALLAAFKSEEELGFMVKRALRIELNRITQNDQGFETTVDIVVERAASNGKLLALTLGSLLQKPGSPELRQFAENNLKGCDLFLM